MYELLCIWQSRFHKFHSSYIETMRDQVNYVLYELKHNPCDKQIVTHVHQDFHEMYFCPYFMRFHVIKEKNKDCLVLNGILNQSFQNVLATNNWNVRQYSILLMMFAQVCGMEVGELIHVISDVYIYDKHISVVNKLIEDVSYNALVVKLNPFVKNFMILQKMI